MRGRHRGAQGAQLAQGRIAIGFAISRHRPDADAFLERGLSEYEIPSGTGPEIGRRDCQHRGVGRLAQGQQYRVQ